nr:serine/threonine-protein kinase [Kofleriaceae bacterium]
MPDDDGTGDTLPQGPGQAPTVRGHAGARPSVPRDLGTPAPGDASTGSLAPTNALNDAGSGADPATSAGMSGRYTLGSVLGRGGMGEVMLATDEQIGREVAVKRMRSREPSAEERARFVREARVQGRLEHPAVVPVHDLASDAAGRPFFVMKRLAGKPMSDLLAAQRQSRSAEVDKRLLRAFADVCLAVEFAHDRGIIHRDLKPANIMLGDFGEVYVLDWGIARALADVSEAHARPVTGDLSLETGETRPGAVLGTPAYMAPEQLAGEPAGRGADVYSLGCMLFEIVAGEPLHRGARSIVSAAHAPDTRPSVRRADAPPELDAICVLATAYDPAARCPSARALGDAVQAYLDGDRDVALRARLAREHVDTARAALAASPGEDARRRAMQAAGRALALDPTADGAAEIVTSLMLEPPRVMPAEVAARIARQDADGARAQGRLAALTMLGYLAFLPLLAWTGIKDRGFVAAFEVLAVASAAHVYLMMRRTRDRVPVSGIYVNAAINAVLIGLICRMVGPFIIAPTLAAAALIAYAAHPLFGRARIIALMLGAGVAVPWLLELAGAIDPTYRFHDGILEMRSDIIDFSEAPVEVAFAVLLVMVLAEVALFSRTLALRQRAASTQLELQAWHLRQIVPARAA